MKNNYSQNEKFFRSALAGDEPGIRPDKAIADRLNYHYIISHPYRRIQNSFTGMFAWIFSMKNFAFKASMASVLLAYMLIFGSIRNTMDNGKFTDEFRVNTLVVDTNFTFKDTCWQTTVKN